VTQRLEQLLVEIKKIVTFTAATVAAETAVALNVYMPSIDSTCNQIPAYLPHLPSAESQHMALVQPSQRLPHTLLHSVSSECGVVLLARLLLLTISSVSVSVSD
jgi:hypothetical protein